MDYVQLQRSVSCSDSRCLKLLREISLTSAIFIYFCNSFQLLAAENWKERWPNEVLALISEIYLLEHVLRVGVIVNWDKVELYLALTYHCMFWNEVACRDSFVWTETNQLVCSSRLVRTVIDSCLVLLCVSERKSDCCTHWPGLTEAVLGLAPLAQTPAWEFGWDCPGSLLRTHRCPTQGPRAHWQEEQQARQRKAHNWLCQGPV